MKSVEECGANWIVSCALLVACGGDHEPEDAGEDVANEAPEDASGDSTEDAPARVLELECEGDEYAYYFFTYDGEEGNSGCLTPTVRVSRPSDDVTPPFVSSLATEEEGALPEGGRICSAGFGSFDIPVSSPGWSPNIGIAYGLGGDCDQTAFNVGGGWHVIEEGSWEDVIEVEAHDVTFDSLEGHELTIDRIFFRTRLPPYPPPPEIDAGVGDAASDA